MLKDVLISLRTIQTSDVDDDDVVEFSTDGVYSFDGENACLSYMETEVTGMEGTRTSVIIMPNQVVVDRDGLITSRMVFRERERNTFPYNTPYGTATMGLCTQKIIQNVGKHGGFVSIDYVVDIEYTVVTRNKFQLTITELNQIGEQKNV
jgi:uncharacterized beta-barrel protein YwiB (DUF1934 family)